MARGVQRKIIKILMKALERKPIHGDYRLNEVFRDRPFIEGGDKEREEIMFRSSECVYHDESRLHSFESFFKYDFSGSLKGKIALDLGCFTGGRAVVWAERWQLGQIFGIDTQDVFITAAQNFADKKGVNAKFIRSYGENLPFEDEKFDAIFSFDVFEHVQDVKKVLSECHRVLKRHGRLFLAFPSFYGLIDHHLSLVTLTPLIHVLFKKDDLIDVYNEIIDERGEEASWYRRQIRDLEPWERGNTINGTSAKMFARLVKDMKWKVVARNHVSMFRRMSKQYRILLPVNYLLSPLVGLPLFEEFISRIIYILEKT
jgi:ubiquinone/menaquinone biosynthesis C-methylase UbiE